MLSPVSAIEFEIVSSTSETASSESSTSSDCSDCSSASDCSASMTTILFSDSVSAANALVAIPPAITVVANKTAKILPLIFFIPITPHIFKFQRKIL